MALTVLAQITAVPGKEAFVRKALEGLVAPTRLEAGCIQYDLHVDNETPGFFVFYETWESADHLAAHGRSAHIAAYRAATKDAIASFSVNKMTLIG